MGKDKIKLIMLTMKQILILIGISMLALASCKSVTEPDRPNIILILSDDQSWTDYSFMGHEHIQTPRLDQLAAEGLTITNSYTTAPLCRPALVSIVTGLYSYQHKILGNDPVFPFPDKQGNRNAWMEKRGEENQSNVDAVEALPTLPDLLGELGYLSLQTGKWWEGHFSVGGFTEGMTHGDPSRGGRHGDAGLKIGREGMDIIYDFIDESTAGDSPFFIWYAPFLPHAPHTPPDSLLNKYLTKTPSKAVAKYWAMCEWFDITCGQLMDYVEEKGLSENTLFIYVTDNGWIQDPDRANRYASRSKQAPYDMGIRTPIMYRWKGKIAPEMDTVSLSSSVDIATTILSVCGLEPTAEMQGIDVLDKEERSSREAVFAEVYQHDFQEIESSLKHRAIISKPWKLILTSPAYKPELGPELYNLALDPFEWDNKADENPAIVEQLAGEIDKWWNK